MFLINSKLKGKGGTGFIHLLNVHVYKYMLLALLLCCWPWSTTARRLYEGIQKPASLQALNKDPY